MDARKNKEEAAYNLFIFLRFFRFFTFANACNYVRDSILSSGSELIMRLTTYTRTRPVACARLSVEASRMAAA